MDFSCRRLSHVLMAGEGGCPVESSTGEPLASTIGLVGVGSSAARQRNGGNGWVVVKKGLKLMG